MADAMDYPTQPRISTHSDYPFGNEGDGYDTDITFCIDDDDLEGSDPFTVPPPVYENRVLDTLTIPPKRKAKTIFSLDLPFEKRKITSAKPRSLTFIRGEFGGGDSPGKLHNTRSYLCKVILPYGRSFKLILDQKPSTDDLFSSYPSDEPYTATLHLKNPTNCKQAFRIYTNTSGLLHFQINPRSGIIPPMGQISVLVKTKADEVTGRQPLQTMVAGDTISFKFFPAYFGAKLDDSISDADLKRFLFKLQELYPDYIHVTRIGKVVLRNSMDLSSCSTLHLTPKISQEQKAELYSTYSTEVLDKVNRNRAIRNFQIKVLESMQKMRKALRWLYYIRLGLVICPNLLIFAGFASFIMPILEEAGRIQPTAKIEIIEPKSWMESAKDYLYGFWSY